MFCAKRGQSILEYAILIAIVIAAVVLMQVYVKRSYQGRLKHEADSLGTQYSQGHTTGRTTVTTSSNSVTYTGGVTDTADNPNGGDPLITQSGITVDQGVSVTVSKSKTNVSGAERVDSLSTEKLYTK